MSVKSYDLKHRALRTNRESSSWHHVDDAKHRVAFADGQPFDHKDPITITKEFNKNFRKPR